MTITIPAWVFPLVLTLVLYGTAQLLAMRSRWHDFGYHIELIKNHTIATIIAFAVWLSYGYLG